MKRIILLATTAIAVMLPSVITAKIVHLMPTPQRIESQGTMSPTVISDVVWIEGATDRISRAAETLLGVRVWPQSGAPTIVVDINDEMPAEGDYSLEGYDYEGYILDTTGEKVKITARNETGAIRALATLSQLSEGYADGERQLEACVITDYPAFKLRGYMHDVGRSFIPFDELRKQLIIFSRFKVNTFHFHLTENQAWRFEVKAFPQLTAEENMTRFAGGYYTQEQCRELDELAYLLGVNLMPEIDMPGHSGAFERAMGHKMQTSQGMAELKTILSEVAATFAHAEYIHIGADETTITYPSFIETLTAHIHSLGKKVAVWNPASGIAITKAKGIDMTQMWSTAGKAVSGMPNIDCRYNYINHFDLFADLVGIYRSNVYYAEKGNADIAGEITAVWNDRHLTDYHDIMRQNNVYASVLASNERAWKGRGKQYIEQKGAILPTSGTEHEEFADWEKRFLFHKENSLPKEDIAYVGQSNIRWTITDPFPNYGNKDAVFPPETEGLNDNFTYQGRKYATHQAAGATVYLRHTWGTIVPGLYAEPAINHTAYAWTYVYSPEEQDAGALIEFQNYGRSEKDLAADNGKWDRKGSRLWLNDEEIIAPDWTNAGQNITLETPLGNENCTARPPVPIRLKAGWNKIVMKLPYVEAQGVRLNKWMFTFVITDEEGNNALDNIEYRTDSPSAIGSHPMNTTSSADRLYSLSGSRITQQEAAQQGIFISSSKEGNRKIIVK